MSASSRQRHRWLAAPWRWACSLLCGSMLLCAPARAEASDDYFVYRADWRKFGTADYIATGVLVTALLTLEFTQSGPTEAQWTDPVPYIDRPTRDAVVAPSRASRERAALYSDRLYHAIVVYPVVDATLTPMIRGGNLFAAWQMTMMNVQAFATSLLLLRMPQKWIGRSRPTDIGCREEPEYSSQCNSTIRFVSFPGGHFLAATTGAGLTCAHHLHGKLYGGSADVIACGSTLGASAIVGYLRLYADEHWLSDQIAAGATGLFSGYALPTLLYYRPFWRTSKPVQTPISSGMSALQWTLVPQLTRDTLGLSLLLFEGG